MGMSVWEQVDSNKYFSLTSITHEKMVLNGLNMTVKELQALARKSPKYFVIFTGQSRDNGYRQKTKIYRYEDFKNVGTEEEQQCLKF